MQELDPEIVRGDVVAISRALEQSLGRRSAELLLHCMTRAEAPTALVGGWLRDLVLGRSSADVDLVTADPDAFAQQLRAAGASKSVLLDPVRRTWRVVLAGGVYVDLSAPRGDGEDALRSDLERRDLRVNAMAWSAELGLVDPLGGLDDLRDGIFRPASATALAEDPLRALRSWRLALQLEMRLAPELCDQMQGLNLADISGERIVSELRQILLHPRAADAFEALASVGLLRQLFPASLRIGLLRRCLARSYQSPALQRCLAAVREGGDAWSIGLRLGWLVEAPRLRKELLRRRWSRRSARLATIASAQVNRALEDSRSADQLDADLRRWKDASAVAILGRVAQLSEADAEALAARYLEVLAGRALGGALADRDDGARPDQ